MRRSVVTLGAVLALFMLAACLPGFGERRAGDGGGASNPLAVEAISVSALPAVASPAAAVTPVPAVAPLTPEASAKTPAEAPVDPPPPVVKSPAQLSCEGRSGVWALTPNGNRACLQHTRDAGKTCRSAGQCDSACLARSNSCAPLKPLFGCNDILDDMGRRMRQCLD